MKLRIYEVLRLGFDNCLGFGVWNLEFSLIDSEGLGEDTNSR